MSGGPPRARPRVVSPAPPTQPYPHATDFEVTVEEEPIPLTSEYVPTLTDLSQQIGAVDRRVAAVHRDVAMTRSEVADLRKLVTADHAPRISAVEKRLPPLPPWLKKGGAYGAIAAAYPLLEWLIPLAQKWIESR